MNFQPIIIIAIHIWVIYHSWYIISREPQFTFYDFAIMSTTIIVLFIIDYIYIKVIDKELNTKPKYP